MNPYLVIILAALVGRFLLDLLSDGLNLRNLREDLPEAFRDVYDAGRYAQSQRYLRQSTRFGVFADTVETTVTIAFMLLGGFNAVDLLARSAGAGPIATGLVFTAALVLLGQVLAIPFAVYDTFVIEARFGFNRTTVRTFILDRLKAALLAVIIGAPVYAGILWFFEHAGAFAWLYAWGGLTTVQLLLVFAAPYLILPLFNKYAPLEPGDVRSAIEDYARAQQFPMRGVFRMDGSRRSAKSNAFFTGWGKSRRIVLLDTLLDRHTVDELVAVVAHEAGHYKRGHVPLAMLRSVAATGLTLALLSFFINNEGLFAAFGMEALSVHASLVFFGFLYTPVSKLMAVAGHAISRRHEFEADAFAAETTGQPEAMIQALKKLAVDNLANLTPHPLKVFLEYSHPPLLARIAALRGRGSETEAP